MLCDQAFPAFCSGDLTVDLFGGGRKVPPPPATPALPQQPSTLVDNQMWYFLIHWVFGCGGRLLACFQLIGFSLSHGIMCTAIV